MGKNNIEVVICKTCLRDNPGDDNFLNFDSNAAFYQASFKESWFKKSAVLKYQNCFAQCENFHCVQISKNGSGFLLKEISSPEKQQEVIDWVRSVKAQDTLKLPEKLKSLLIAPIVCTEKYHKV